MKEERFSSLDILLLLITTVGVSFLIGVAIGMLISLNIEKISKWLN